MRVQIKVCSLSVPSRRSRGLNPGRSEPPVDDLSYRTDKMAAGRDFLLCAAIVLMTQMVRHVQADCRTDLANVVAEQILTIQENSPAGTVILEITTDYTSLHFTPSAPGGFATVINGSIVTDVDVSLDGAQNSGNCAKSKLPQQLTMYCNSDTTNSRAWNLLVNYTDDYGPHFTAVETSVNESAPVGTTVIDLNTIVRDDDCTNAFNFYIDDKSKQYFKLMGSNLELTQSLDYETAQEHLINLTVLSSIQNGQDYLRNTTTLTVGVLDVDDMSPVFDISQFQLPLPEGQDISSNWYSTSPPIEARDGDVGINTTLVYSLHSVSPSLSLQINNLTGQVNVLEQLDRENIPVYTVVVKAAQADVTYKSATGTLILVVEDANDNRPVFTSQPGAAITEDAPDGSYVMELTGEDSDEGDNSLFNFVITSDTVGAFAIRFDQTTNRSQLIVGNSTALRGHSQAIVQFYLRELRPIVGPPCSNTTTCAGQVTIIIIDVNDHTPQFNSSSYTFALPSNTSGRYVIGQVFAEDGDRGNNALVKYSSTPVTGPPECSTISLDPSTGVLATDQHLPPGATCSWLLTACDSPTDTNTRRCSVVPLTVSVIPAGNIVESSVTIPENVPVGTMVKALPMKGLHTKSTEFEIRNDSVLYTKVPLDREQRDSYEVTIVSDQNVNVSVMIVHVNVSDVNDNVPVFGQSVYVINIDRSWEINETVLQVNASDADIGPNARLEFSMVTGKEYFAIDPTTGQIRLTNFPTTRDSEYQLLVTDFGSPALSSVSTLKVYSPVFNETASIVLPVSRDELMADREGVARKLGSILGMTVRIYDIERLGPAGSKVYISATSADGQPISPTELNRLLDTHEMEIYNTFAKSYQPNADSDGGRTLSVLEIVLICLASVLLILVLLATFLWYRNHKKLRQSRRLFDSLNKDTAIYDNPRKPSSSAAVISNNNNNSTNAQRMMARLSSGSVGNSSVTNLLTAQGDGNNSQGVTPPGSNGSQRRQQDHDYQNVVTLPLSNPVVNHEDIDATSPVEADREQITTFSSQITDEAVTTKIYPHMDESNQHEFVNSQAWPDDNTAFSGRRNSSIISDTETQMEDADEDDQEVADILSEPNPGISSLEDTVDSSTNRSNLDLMTTSSELEGSHPGGTDNPAYLDTDNLESSLPPEPEPDYAKRVRFTDVTATVDSSEITNSPDNDDKDSSLAKFLNQYGGAENLATNADTTQDSLEEMTAL